MTPMSIVSGANTSTEPTRSLTQKFHGTTAENNSTGGRVILPDTGDVFTETPRAADRVRPAKIDLLFNARTSMMLRQASSQRNHCAIDAFGIRSKPTSIERVPLGYDKASRSEPCLFSDHQGLYLLGFTEESLDPVAVSIDEANGQVRSATLPSYGPNTVWPLECAVPTKQGLACRWKVSSEISMTESLTHFDPNNNEILWTQTLFNGGNPKRDVIFLGCMPNGDIVVFLSEHKDKEKPVAQFLRFDGKTGDVRYDEVCPWPKSYNEASFLYLASKGAVGHNRPQILFFDEENETAVIGRSQFGNECLLYTLDFARGAIAETGRIPYGPKQTYLTQVGNGQTLFLPHQAGVEAKRLEIRQGGTFRLHPFKAESLSADSLISNTNRTHAVGACLGTLSFFALDDSKIALTELLLLGGRTQDTSTAMTKDGVVYHSIIVNDDDVVLKCQLHAFDATTREQLWSFEENFSFPPTIGVSANGTITWVDRTKAVILKN